MRNKSRTYTAPQFNAKTALMETRKVKRIAVRKRYRSSKLDRYEDELNALHSEGASLAEIKLWLSRTHHLKISRSTIFRWLNKHG